MSNRHCLTLYPATFELITLKRFHHEILPYGSSIAYENVPQEAVNLLIPLGRKAANYYPAFSFDIAFAPNGGWVILYGRNGYYAHNTSQETINVLNSLRKRDRIINSIAFAPNGGWVVIYNNFGYYARNVSQATINSLGRMYKSVSFLSYIAFTPSNASILLCFP